MKKGQKRGGAAKPPVVRMTAARYVNEKYGEKGLRALRAMGPDFARDLQDEILIVRKRGVLSARRDRAMAALRNIEVLIEDIPDGDGTLFRKIQTVIDALPDIIKEKPKAEEEAKAAEPVEVSAQSGG
jgi:hypothetical protein